MKSLQEIYDATEEVTPRISDLTLFCLFFDSEPIRFAEVAQDKRWSRVKWVYKVKKTTKGKVERYEARLSAKGYSQ